VPSRAIVGAEEPAVGVVEIEFEAAAWNVRADASVFIFRAAEHPHHHVIDELGDIEQRFDRGVIGAERLYLLPDAAVAVIRRSGIGPAADVPVAIDRLVRSEEHTSEL